MKTKKIIKALKIIMDECGKYDDSCEECIFSNEEYGMSVLLMRCQMSGILNI